MSEAMIRVLIAGGLLFLIFGVGSSNTTIKKIGSGIISMMAFLCAGALIGLEVSSGVPSPTQQTFAENLVYKTDGVIKFGDKGFVVVATDVVTQKSVVGLVEKEPPSFFKREGKELRAMEKVTVETFRSSVTTRAVPGALVVPTPTK